MDLVEWLDKLVLEALPRTDQSTSRLEELLAQGYTEVSWHATNAIDFNCLELNGQTWPLDEFLYFTKHNAPMFSKSHVNCNCRLIVRGPNLPEVNVDTY